MNGFSSARIVCFTERGKETAERIAAGGDAQIFRCFGLSHPPLSDFVRGAFVSAHCGERTLAVFVGAVGIAVRSIAPFLREKTVDAAVVCVDEGGRFAIPLVGGHIGGANDAAREIARRIGAVAVITTATDGRGAWAFDSWCAARGVAVERTGRIKEISSAVLRGERVFSLGVGCKKSADGAALGAFVRRVFRENDLDVSLVASVSSIDRKRGERAILDLASSLGARALFFTSDELNALSGEFSSSDFVLATTGVDCVCERAAVRAKEGSQLIVRKVAEDGMTVAVAV